MKKLLLAAVAFMDLGLFKAWGSACIDWQLSEFGDSVAVDAALSWISRPGRFMCPEAYSNDTYRYVADQAKAIGVRHMRERLKWAESMPEPGVWCPGRYLANAEMLRERGISISSTFHDAPEYALPDKKLPRDLAATFAFCKRLAETFGDRMEMWEFWNEEDIGFTNEGAWEFAAAFKAASLGFRAGGFRGIVAPGALCRADRGAYEDTMYRNGVAQYADVMNFHVYSPPSAYGKVLAEMRGFMSGFGIGDRAIVVTECGTNLEGLCDEDGAMPGVKRHSPQQEAVQEEFVVKSQILMRMEGVLRNYFFAFGAFNERNGKKDWGIMRRDGTMKPAASALGRMIDEVGAGTLVGEIETSNGKVRAFRFDMPDGSTKIAYWRRTAIDDGKGEVSRVSMWFDMAERASIRLEDGSEFAVKARRNAQYALLPSSAPVKTQARGIGRIGAHSSPGEDLAVVLRADFDRSGYVLGGNKSTLNLKGDAIGFSLEVWNLDAAAKRGRIVFAGRGKVSGMPQGEIIVPPQDKVALRLEYAPCGEANPEISFLYVSGERKSSPFVVPVFSEAKYRVVCDEVEFSVGDMRRWRKNSSATSQDCEWDEKEGAVKFSMRWDGDKGRWFFPRYSLDLPRESMDKARLLAFRVKSSQDKVENDYSSARIYFKGKDGSKQFMCSAPTHDWETKYIEITEAVRRMDVREIEFGGHPKGRQVDFWVRDVRLFREKTDAVFNVRDFGAVGDGVANDTAAIQRAIDAASAGRYAPIAPQSEVLIPAGTYRCGSLFLKSGVDFHLAEGAVLKASPSPNDYNALDVCPQNSGGLGKGDNTSGGHLLLCIGQNNVTLRGPGKIDGNAGAFLKMSDGSYPPTKMDIPWRPSQMVWFVESMNVVVRDIELADAPYWSCFLYGCGNVQVKNVNIHTIRDPHTYNGDGLDIDCCRHVRVKGCMISTADDAITLRANGARLTAGGGVGGRAGRVNLPECADVTVEDCALSSDCNAVRMGVGNGMIRDCAFRNTKIANTRYAVNAVGAWGRPAHGVDIRNVLFEDMEIDALGFCKFYYNVATGSVFEGISFRNVRGKVREPSIFDDTPDRPFRKLSFENVRIEGETSPRIMLAETSSPKLQSSR